MSSERTLVDDCVPVKGPVHVIGEAPGIKYQLGWREVDGRELHEQIDELFNAVAALAHVTVDERPQSLCRAIQERLEDLEELIRGDLSRKARQRRKAETVAEPELEAATTYLLVSRRLSAVEVHDALEELFDLVVDLAFAPAGADEQLQFRHDEVEARLEDLEDVIRGDFSRQARRRRKAEAEARKPVGGRPTQ